MRDDERTNKQLKIELLSQWKLEAESRNSCIFSLVCKRFTLIGHVLAGLTGPAEWRPKA